MEARNGSKEGMEGRTGMVGRGKIINGRKEKNGSRKGRKEGRKE